MTSLREVQKPTYLMSDDELERYVRIKLGQTNFEARGEIDVPERDHLRINFDARYNDYEKNKELLNLFIPDFKKYRVIMVSHKGLLQTIIVTKYNNLKFNYWDLIYDIFYDRNIHEFPKSNKTFPYVQFFDGEFGDYGTVLMIVKLIQRIDELELMNLLKDEDDIDTYLDVSYTSKDRAKLLGAYYDGNQRKWYIPRYCKNKQALLKEYKVILDPRKN
jgi:hypothetical protein